MFRGLAIFMAAFSLCANPIFLQPSSAQEAVEVAKPMKQAGHPFNDVQPKRRVVVVIHPSETIGHSKGAWMQENPTKGNLWSATRRRSLSYVNPKLLGHTVEKIEETRQTEGAEEPKSEKHGHDESCEAALERRGESAPKASMDCMLGRMKQAAGVRD